MAASFKIHRASPNRPPRMPKKMLSATNARAAKMPKPKMLRNMGGFLRVARRSGIAAVAFDEPAANRLKEEVARQRQGGLRCDWLDGDEVRERWPGAAPECQGALLAPEDGALDPQALTRACLADARRLGATLQAEQVEALATDRKSTRLNSSHDQISYAVFCLKKKK